MESILNSRRHHSKLKSFVIWKRLGTKHNSREPRINLNNCVELIHESDFRFLKAASRHFRTRRKK